MFVRTRVLIPFRFWVVLLGVFGGQGLSTADGVLSRSSTRVLTLGRLTYSGPPGFFSFAGLPTHTLPNLETVVIPEDSSVPFPDHLGPRQLVLRTHGAPPTRLGHMHTALSAGMLHSSLARVSTARLNELVFGGSWLSLRDGSILRSWANVSFVLTVDLAQVEEPQGVDPSRGSFRRILCRLDEIARRGTKGDEWRPTRVLVKNQDMATRFESAKAFFATSLRSDGKADEAERAERVEIVIAGDVSDISCLCERVTREVAAADTCPR